MISRGAIVGKDAITANSAPNTTPVLRLRRARRSARGERNREHLEGAQRTFQLRLISAVHTELVG